MQKDQQLWSGCISGAFTEEGFLKAFQDAGFENIQVLERAAEPWRTVQAIAFRSVTVEAWKGKSGSCCKESSETVSEKKQEAPATVGATECCGGGKDTSC